MNRRLTITTIGKAAASLGVLAAAWYFLAPAQLGGANTYLVTYGTSMQPAYHAGDLAVIRPAASYRVGEIVAYRNMSLGGHLVLHRIIGIENGVYTFKGDNNHFIDSFHPNRSELVGRLWVHVPSAGRYLLLLHGRGLFLIGALIALLFAGGAALSRRDGRRQPSARPTVSASPGLEHKGARLALCAAAALGLSVLLGVLAYGRPTTKTVQAPLYTQSGRFSYTAATKTASDVYPDGRVTTGQPLLLGLVHDAQFEFAYRFRSSAAHSLAGTASLTAEVSAPDGWTHELPVGKARKFSGDTVVVGGRLDLEAMTKLLARLGALTNDQVGALTLTLKPHVQVHGTIGVRPLVESFSPSLPFAVDQYELNLQAGSAAGPSSATLLTQSTQGTGPAEVPNTLSLLKLRVSVERARQLAILGGNALLVALVVALAFAWVRRPRSEAAAIADRFSELVVDVLDAPERLGVPTVAVASFDGLSQIADGAGASILRSRQGSRDVYFVQHGGYVYVFEPSDEEQTAVERASSPILEPALWKTTLETLRAASGARATS